MLRYMQYMQSVNEGRDLDQYKKAHVLDPPLKDKDINKGAEFKEFEPSARQKSEDNTPEKIMEMNHTLGAFSGGVDKDKKMFFVMNNLRGPYDKSRTNDQKRVQFQRALPMTDLRSDKDGRFYTNNTDKGKSALLYTDKAEKGPVYMLRQIRKALEAEDNESIDAAAPFLSAREEKDEMKMLSAHSRRMLENGEEGLKKSLDKETGSRVNFLHRSVQMKEQRRIQFTNRLTQMINDVNRGRKGPKRSGFETRFNRFEAPESLPADGNKGGGPSGSGNDFGNGADSPV